ncbi:sensor histidine kinase [Longimicrobium sp.]|uniref:sensor histidine kinase n=1 Tax=Longimicrobium sp. TaxID=2029185 RepID=UPI002C7F8A4A|nr:response regulator [Longimicrobium sp.]HSU12850.1 response regulator [Longimicrobium sp.]
MSEDFPVPSVRLDEPRGEHILIAEDDPAAARILRQILQQIGYRVTVAEDGAQALRALDEGPPDLLLLDWMLPGISGLEICHQARERWDPLSLPILMVTAKTDPESVYAAFDAGASDYVAKPFRGAELRARIAAHLRTKRMVEERRRMEDHLRERDRLSTLGLLTSGVAHDLNNPLAVISAHAQILMRRAPDEGTSGQLREILDAVERCRRIAGDLLGFARRHPVEREPLDLGEVVRATLELRRRDMELHGLRTTVSIPGALPRVIADRHQMQQVFLNIVVNAEQALAGGGGRFDVAVETDAAREAVTVRFTNDGPPIPASALPHIFDPFFTTKPEDEGTGLGLAIGRRIVQEHGGEITVTSDAAGTTFTVRLPVEAMAVAGD